MADKDDFARTMRIDIHPDFQSESLAKERLERDASHRTGDTTTSLSVSAKKARKRERALEYQQLLQCVYDAVVITNSKGRIVDFNTRALDFFRTDEDELIGAKVVDFISGADGTLLTAIWKNLEDHRYTLIEAHCIRTDKSMFPAEIAVNKIDLPDGRHLSFFVRDVSVRRRAQAALEEAVARLEEHDRSRSLFVTNVSHELKTPLTSMIYAVANLLRGAAGPLPERVEYYLQILDGDCKRLSRTVNDILDLRKLDTKTLTLAKTKVPLARLVRCTVESLGVQVEQKRLKLNISTGSEKWFVDCDHHRMERVIMNLAGNAVKFTPEGGTVEVSVKDDPLRPGHVVFSVQDDGIGIPPEAIGRVTERYFTVGEQASGSGLGLAISKEIVELHGGTIVIQSPPPGFEKGTLVSISLALADPPTLLIVDDDKAVLDLLNNQMTIHGYRVITAEDGLEALAKVEKERPDVVLLDLVLPGMEGTEIILKMKSDKNLVRIPIIVITGAHMGRGKADILNSFSIPALLKPWRESELLDRVEGAFLGTAAFVG
jgi:PAS domain S-box-containing protein